MERLPVAEPLRGCEQIETQRITVGVSLRDSHNTQQSCGCPPWKGGPTVASSITSQRLRGSDFRGKAEWNVDLGETDLQ